MTEPTLRDLRPAGDEIPLHHRTIDMQAFERDGYLVVIGTLHDQRPWASGQFGPRHLHHMELGLVVRRADMVIVDAQVTMSTFPHAECPTIEDAFSDLIGLSVARGYSGAVQERFGRQRGCSHVEFLARALGPVVIQALTSSSAWAIEQGGTADAPGTGGLGFLSNTCHLWSEDGIGAQKVAIGWLPGRGEYPVPSLVELRKRSTKAPG